jgi:phytoene/squalene synthetase
MQTRGRSYTSGTEGEEVSPGLKALEGIELYVRGLIADARADLKELEKKDHPNPMVVPAVRARLRAKVNAYKEVLQYIKEGKEII